MKKIIFITAIIIGFSVNTYCQTDGAIISSPISNDTIPKDPYTAVDQMPCFPGGETELYKFLGTQIHYPDSAKKLGLQGKLYVEFIVCKSGKICDFKIRKGSIGKGCEEEAIRALKNMPDWIPGKLNGETVAVRYTLPVVFKLNNDANSIKNDTLKTVYEVADQMPSFPGGEAEMYKFIGVNFKYPQDARELEMQGKLLIEFIVRKTGKIEEVKIISGHIGGGCEEEYIRVIKAMPDWIPGISKGKPVDIRFRMPFALNVNNGNDFQYREKSIKTADKIDVEPQYFGGQEKLNKYLAKKIKLPKKNSKGEFSIFKVLFIIDEKGAISNIKVSSNTAKFCEDVVYSTINNMPKWIPAKLNGKNVATWYSLTITLNDLTDK